MSASEALKRAYVQVMRGARGLARGVGVLGWLERRSDSRRARWLRSLFAIHDVEEMIRLDVPWWTYDAIEEVDRFLRERPGARVFEYGSGASTVWLAKRAGCVVSVEHDLHWGAVVKGLLKDHGNAELRLVERDAERDPDPLYGSTKAGHKQFSYRKYAAAIDAETEPFDLIVVDGRARVACFTHGLRRLRPGGVIVFDNSHRSSYREAIQSSAARKEVYKGLAPGLPYSDETTLIYPEPQSS